MSRTGDPTLAELTSALGLERPTTTEAWEERLQARLGREAYAQHLEYRVGYAGEDGPDALPSLAGLARVEFVSGDYSRQVAAGIFDVVISLHTRPVHLLPFVPSEAPETYRRGGKLSLPSRTTPSSRTGVWRGRSRRWRGSPGSRGGLSCTSAW